MIDVQSRRREPGGVLGRITYSLARSSTCSTLCMHGRAVCCGSRFQRSSPRYRRKRAFFLCSLTSFLTEISRCHHRPSPRQPQPCCSLPNVSIDMRFNNGGRFFFFIFLEKLQTYLLGLLCFDIGISESFRGKSQTRLKNQRSC